MEGGQQYNPRTVEEVFRDFKGRRAGLIKALTTGIQLNFAHFPLIFVFFLAGFYYLISVGRAWILQMLKNFTSSATQVKKKKKNSSFCSYFEVLSCFCFTWFMLLLLL